MREIQRLKTLTRLIGAARELGPVVWRRQGAMMGRGEQHAAVMWALRLLFWFVCCPARITVVWYANADRASSRGQLRAPATVRTPGVCKRPPAFNARNDRNGCLP